MLPELHVGKSMKLRHVVYTANDDSIRQLGLLNVNKASMRREKRREDNDGSPFTSEMIMTHINQNQPEIANEFYKGHLLYITLRVFCFGHCPGI